MNYFRIKAPDLAIDIGTAFIRISRLDRQSILEEPCVVALDYKRLEILAVGQEAKDLMGKSPDNIIAIHPLKDGVVSDYDLTQALLEYYIRGSLPGISLLAPRLTVAFPSGATDVEQRAIQDACYQSGAREVFLVEEALAAAFGAGRITSASKGVFILNMGAGTNQIAVVNRYGVVTSETIRRSGKAMDEAIISYIQDKYKLVIGENTAESLKIKIASLRQERQQDSMELGGRDLLTGMPKNIEVFTSDLTEALTPFVLELVDRIRLVLEKTPPELSSDVMESGLFMTGAGAQLDGLAEYIQMKLKIATELSAHPTQDTILGARYVMSHIEDLIPRGEKHDSLQKN